MLVPRSSSTLLRAAVSVKPVPAALSVLLPLLSRLCEKVLDVSHVANLLAALCEAAAGNSAGLMQQAAELLVRLMTAPYANRLCDQLR